MKDAGEEVNVVQDAGDVRGRAECPDLPGTVGVCGELPVQILGADPPVRVEIDVDRVSDRLPPGDVVRVVLHQRPEDDRAVRFGNLPEEVMPLLELVRNPEAEDEDQPVDGSRGAGADRDQNVFARRPDIGADPGERLLVALRHVTAAGAAFGVCVGHEREDPLGQLLLDVAVKSSGGDVVEIAELLRTEGPWDRRVGAEDAAPKAPEKGGFFRRRGGRERLPGR